MYPRLSGPALDRLNSSKICVHCPFEVVLCCAAKAALQAHHLAIGGVVEHRQLVRGFFRPQWLLRCRPASHPSLLLARHRSSLGGQLWCAMVSSDAEAGGARVGKPSPLPFFATTPSPLCLAASQQRIEEQQQRGAGLLLSLAASAALVFGAGPASADVKLPPLDNGAHVFQHDDEESVLWTWLAQMPPHHARRDVRRAGRPLERRAAQPASALPPQTRTAASAATWGTPSGRPTLCPTSPWTCASASTRGTTSAARRCRVRRRAALVADWPHAAPAHCQPTPICVHEPLWLRTRFLSQVKSSQPLLLLC